MEKNKRYLKIRQGEEYKIRLGCVYEKEGLFYEAYQQGAEILKETLRASSENKNERNGCIAGSTRTEDENMYEFANNIIAFCGGRGEGKSSAMRTFAHALEHIATPKQDYSYQDINQFWGIQIEKYAFEILPVIDPTMLREQDFFMRVILSRMFAQFRKRCELNSENTSKFPYMSQRSDRPGEDQIRRILERFRECYAYLDTRNRILTTDVMILRRLQAWGIAAI